VVLEPALRKRLRLVVEKINRDEVDAERQLRLGGGVPDQLFDAAREAAV
jgi:hypothetical protein